MDTPAYADTSNAAFSILTQPTLADALDTTGLTWTTSGNANWFSQSATTHDGIDAAQSGAIADSQNSYMETTVTGPGTLTFWWKVSSESNYDFLRFYLDGTEQTGSLAKISGTVDWEQKTVAIPAGNHTVKWGYTKDVSVSSNADAAWVDQVVYTPSAAPEIAVEQPVGTDLVDGGASVDCGFAGLSGSAPPITFTVRNPVTPISPDSPFPRAAATARTSRSAASEPPRSHPVPAPPSTSPFPPAAVGTRTAAVHIASNDADENPFDIALTGTGVTVGTLVVAPAGNFTPSGTFRWSVLPLLADLHAQQSGHAPRSTGRRAKPPHGWISAPPAARSRPVPTPRSPSRSTASADSFDTGGYTDTVTFANTTNGNGDTTRGVSLTVNPIIATVTLGNLGQTYDGSPKSASVTTDPPGLAHTRSPTTDRTTAPTNAGTYAVVATITAPNHSGSDSEDLVIAKAAQTIGFAALDPVLDDAPPFALTATATSGLPVSYASSNPAVATVSGDTVTITGVGTTTITASQAGNANYDPAASVPQAAHRRARQSARRHRRPLQGAVRPVALAQRQRVRAFIR